MIQTDPHLSHEVNTPTPQINHQIVSVGSRIDLPAMRL